jgi:hypothetical protein
MYRPRRRRGERGFRHLQGVEGIWCDRRLIELLFYCTVGRAAYLCSCHPTGCTGHCLRTFHSILLFAYSNVLPTSLILAIYLFQCTENCLLHAGATKAPDFYTGDPLVITLSQKHWERRLSGDSIWLVEFYAPWYGLTSHCHCRDRY